VSGIEGETPVSWLVVERGWKVLARDGEEIGRIDELVGDTGKDIFNGLVVSLGLLKGSRYVPAERVARIVEGRVYLDLAADEVETLEDHERPPPSAEVLPP
jgi:hypothetical protein